MGKLVSFLDGKVANEYALNKERMSIGRNPKNDIQLDHPTVSGEHALLISIRQDAFLEDLGSTNGTRVNQQAIKKCVLQDGDEIRIGKFVLKYFAEPAGVDLFEQKTLIGDQENPLTGQSMAEDDGWVRVEAEPQQTQAIHYAPAPRGNRPSTRDNHVRGGLAVLQILSGPGAGKELLLDRTLTTLGKPGVQVAVITRRDDGYFFTFVEGDQYPLINGRTAGGHSHPLHPRDIIELAETKMEFGYK